MKRLVIGVIAILYLMGISEARVILYYDDFDGDAVPLNGTTPDVTIGSNTWTAGALWLANGTYSFWGTGTACSASLPFTPETGKVYALTARLTVDSANAQWLGIGFHSTTYIGGELWATLEGPWMFRKGSAWNEDDGAYTGPATTGWYGIAPPLTPGAEVDFRLIIDTTQPMSSVTFQRKLSTDATYETMATVQDTRDYTTTIGAVVIGALDWSSGNINFIELAEVPEPATVCLLAIGALASLRQRKKLSKQD